MRSLMSDNRSPSSIVLAAIIVAVGIQFGHAQPAPIPAPRHGASASDLIGFTMVNTLQREAASKLKTKLRVNRRIRPREASRIARSVRTYIQEEVFDEYLLEHHAITVWTYGRPKNPTPRSDRTLGDFLGPDVTNSLLERWIHEPLLTRLEELANRGITVTSMRREEIARAVRDDLATGLGCWECIPDPDGELRWHNSCTGDWGGPSLFEHSSATRRELRQGRSGFEGH